MFVCALGLTALSFVLGVAGDLAATTGAPQAEPPQLTSGVRVVLRLPPEIPAAEAAPLRGQSTQRPQAQVGQPLLGAGAAAAAELASVDRALVFRLAAQAELAHAASEPGGVTVG